VNRLDGEDKEYGYIIETRTSSRASKVQSMTTPRGPSMGMTGGCGRALGGSPQQGREKLEETGSRKKPCVSPSISKDSAAYMRYFCAKDSGDPEQLKATNRTVSLSTSMCCLHPRLRQPG